MSEWERVRLGDVCCNLDSKRKPVKASERENGIFPYYGASGIVDYVSQYLFDEDLLLVSEDGANLLARSTPIAFSVSGKVWVNNHAHVLKFDNLYTQKCVELYINHIDISKYVTGSAQPKLNQEKLNDLIIPLPPLDVQNHMAATLDKTQEVIDGHKKQLEELDNLIKATFYDMFGDPIVNEKGWETVFLKDVLADIRYGTSTPPVFSEMGYKFIRATNIKNGRIVEDDMKFISKDEGMKIGKCRMYENTMIVVRSGVNSGDTCVITDEYIGHYAGYDLILEYNQEKASPIFVNELFNTNYMEKVIKPLTRRAAQPHLNSDQVQSLTIILPPLELQKQYISIIHNIEEQKALIKQSITESQNLFNSLMSKYFD